MTLAAAPEALQGAVAAGILGCGSVVLGSSEAAGQFFAAIAAQIAAGAEPTQAATSVILEYRAARRPIPGYGHPLHKGADPRAARLFAVAAEVGSVGVHIDIAHEVEHLLPDLIGKPLPMNVSGAIPAVLLDVGYPLGAPGRGVPILCALTHEAGLIAHLLEEQLRPIGFVLSHAGAAAIDYDGESPPDFEASRE